MNLTSTKPSIYNKIATSGYVNEHWLEFAIGHVNPLWSLARTKARVAAKRFETSDILTLTLIPNRHWHGFIPGQFVPLRVKIGGIVHERYYSLTSAPDASIVQVTVKKIPGGLVSGYIHNELAVGAVIELGGASGDFVLPQQLPAKMLVLAGGVGITPLYSLITEALRRQPDANIVLAYYARTERDFALLARLEAAARIHPNFRIVTRCNTHFSLDELQQYAPDYAARDTWACGPAPMLDAIESLYLDEQLSAQLHTERFGQRQSVAADDAITSQVIAYRRSALEATAEAANLLESAEQAGLKPAYGCRMGICNTCRCHKVEGTVRNTITGEINATPNTEIQLCISQAVTPVTLDL